MGKKQKNQNKKQAKTKKPQEALDFFSEKKLSRK